MGGFNRNPYTEGREMDRTIKLKKVNIVDTISGSISAPLDLIISESEIKDISEIGTSTTNDITEIDCTGKFVIPGLFDCHTHLAALTEQPPEVQREIFEECRTGNTFEEDCFERLVLQDFIRWGITQVRDLGGPVETLQRMKRDISEGTVNGPDIFYAGPMLEMPPLTGASMNERWPGWTVAVESQNCTEEIVSSLADRGVACLKVFGRFEEEILGSFISHAENRGLPVTCDPGPTFFHDIDIRRGLDRGIRCFEHAKSLWYPVLEDYLKAEHDKLKNAVPEKRQRFVSRLMSLGPESISLPRLNELADVMAENRAWLCPTLNICKFYSDKPEVFTDQEPEKYGPVFKTLFDVGCVIVGQLAKRGVRMMVGQDGYIPRFTHRELVLLSENGLSAAEILKGATIYPAEWLGIEDKYGSIAIGKKANLILLDKNPIEDVRNTQAIDTVISDGCIVYESKRTDGN